MTEEVLDCGILCCLAIGHGGLNLLGFLPLGFEGHFVLLFRRGCRGLLNIDGI